MNTNNNENINVNLENRVMNDSKSYTQVKILIDNSKGSHILRNNLIKELEDLGVKYHVIIVKDGDKYGR